MENAAMKAVADHLPEGSTTVGAEMNVTHIKPSGVGAEIVASAVLTEVEGRKLTFNVGARDAEGMIGEGVHVRYVVDREKFMSKVRWCGILSRKQRKEKVKKAVQQVF